MTKYSEIPDWIWRSLGYDPTDSSNWVTMGLLGGEVLELMETGYFDYGKWRDYQ